MTKLMEAFNPKSVDPTQGVGQLPIGKHPVVIVAEEIKPNSNNDGGMLVFELQIIDGPAKGATGAYRLNLYNKSAKAAEIAHRQLSAICHVTGQFQLGPQGDDVSVLRAIPFLVEVVPQADTQYTEIKKVYDINGNEPGKAPTNQAAQVQQNGGNAGNAANWNNGNAAANNNGGGSNWGGGNNGGQQEVAPAAQQNNAGGWQGNAGGNAGNAGAANSKPSWAK